MSRELQIVTGKGGTGKTTVAAALALAHAERGERVLLCEVEGRPGPGEPFGVDLPPGRETVLARTDAGGEVLGLSVDARSALEEYLAQNFRLGIAGRALDRFGLVDFATSIAPGLSDVLLTGKVYEAVRRGQKGRADAYDLVVLDAPPTGRIAQFLNVHAAVSQLAKVGPIHSQASSIMRMFRSPTTVIHLTCLLEDLPVTETLEAVDELAGTQIPLGSILCTLATPPLDGLTPAQVDRAARGDLPLTGIDAALVPGLGAELAADAVAVLAEADHRAELAATGLPLVDLPRVPEGAQRLPELAAALVAGGLLTTEGAR